VNILPHCLPGGSSHAGHSPANPWPGDCPIQWGNNGVVFRKDGEAYRTAFFEAFPRNPGTFIRGEGKTVAEAEGKAWARYEKIRACTEHAFERRDYRNGAGICAKCGMFKSGAFEPLEVCCRCGKPTYFTYDTKNRWWCEACAPDMPEGDVPEHFRWLRKDAGAMKNLTAEQIGDGIKAALTAIQPKSTDVPE